MPTFEPWDVIKVPFPYTDRPVRQRRPALVIAAGDMQSVNGLVWVLMITSAENRGWPDDVPVSDPSAAGLSAASVVRCAKLATIEAGGAERIGLLPRADRKKVGRRLAATLAHLLS